MTSLIQQYYDAFNRKDMEAFFALMSDDIIHDLNQGAQEKGKTTFRAFMERMNRCYDEKVVDLVIFDKGERAAAEFFIEGKYISTDAGLPPAKGQKYRLRCGAFFDLKNNKIHRVTNYYNLQEWLTSVR